LVTQQEENLTTFYLVRHAEPDWSIADSKHLRGLQIEFCPLSSAGIKQAREIATNLLLRNSEIIISSPYTRALQTAAIILRELNLRLIVEYDLHERRFGNVEQHTREEIFNTINNYLALSTVENEHWEKMGSIKNRVLHVLDKYQNFSKVIVVTHGFVISSLVQGVKLQYGELVELTL